MYAEVLRIPFVCTYTVMSWLYKELADGNACRCLLFEPTDAVTAGVEVSG